jgi:hypothetical protein
MIATELNIQIQMVAFTPSFEISPPHSCPEIRMLHFRAQKFIEK